MDVDPLELSSGTNFDRNGAGTGSILGWGIEKGIGTGTGIVKHFQDQGTSTDPGTIGSNIDRATGPLPPISESDLLHPILESESESSLVGLPFKPRTFDDNLAFFFQEVGPLEEEKSVEEIFVSGQKSAVEFGIDLQRREGLRSLDWVRAQIMAEGMALTSSGLPIYGPRQFDSLPQEIRYS